MILVPTDDEKNKQNNQRRNHADKVVGSALLLGANRFKNAAEQQAMEQQKDENVQQDGALGYNNQQGQQQPASFNMASPFMSSMEYMPTVTDGKTTVPSYNVKDIFSDRMEPTQAPVRDAAQDERLKKMAKFNLIAKGLQTVFGGIIGAQGEVVPGPYDGGMTQTLMQNLQGLDDKHFREMAEWRDRELKAQMFNSNQQSQADQVRLQKMRDDAQNLMSQGRYEDAKAAQAEADKYQKDQDAQDYWLRKQDLNLRSRDQSNDSKRLYHQENNQRLQSIESYNESIRRVQDNIKSMQTNADPEEDIKAERESLKKLESERNFLLRQVPGTEGLEMEQPSNQDTTGTLDPATFNKIKNGEVDRSQAEQALMTYFSQKTGDQAAAQAATKNALAKYGYDSAEQRTSPPTEEEIPDPVKRVAETKKWEQSKKETAKKDVIKGKEGEVRNSFANAIGLLDDVSVIDQVEKSFNTEGQRDTAIKTTISKLKKKQSDLEKKKVDNGFFGTNFTKQDHDDLLAIDLAISGLEKSVQDYKQHEKEHGQR